jgi:hypothetical protein
MVMDMENPPVIGESVPAISRQIEPLTSGG